MYDYYNLIENSKEYNGARKWAMCIDSGHIEAVAFKGKPVCRGTLPAFSPLLCDSTLGYRGWFQFSITFLATVLPLPDANRSFDDNFLPSPTGVKL